MSISYNTVAVSAPKFPRRETSRWIKEVAAQYKKRVGAIAYIFCSDEKILRINRQYLQHDYYTDIITFDYSEGDEISGDLFISLETVKSNAEQFKTNYSDELARVMIHGILHLCGFNDKTPEEEQAMRKKEDDAINLMKSSLRG
jgi:rRNA maturation RNase YbeY